MRRIFFIAWWSLLGAAGIIVLARYMHPATFSKTILPLVLGLAFIGAVCSIANKRYE